MTAIKDLEESIRKRFSFLFDNYNFKISLIKEAQTFRDVTLIGLESDFCKIVFARELSTSMFIGAKDNEFYSYNSVKDNSYWVEAGSFIEYIEGISLLDKGANRPVSIDEEIIQLANMLTQYKEKVFSKFRDEKIEDWFDAYDDYLLAGF